MFRRIALDVQHMGKPHRPYDRGASCAGYYEADLVLRYAGLAYQQLVAKRYEVFLLTSGRYSERHEWVNKHGVELYLACHLNAGGGSYSLVEYYYDAGQKTREIASVFADCFRRVLGTSNAKVWEIPKGGRGAVCLEGTRPSALLLEPLFIDNTVHFELVVHQPELVAKAIVRAIEEYNSRLL